MEYSKVKKLLEDCRMCPRNCGADRSSSKLGACRSGINPIIYAYQPHFGEEPPISGRNGSGTIFFSNCNLNCLYCQNYTFSQLGGGREISVEELSDIMLELERMGCHNINLVTPTHFALQISAAVESARKNGLEIPIVYNTGGYEALETIKMLEGAVDIYLADMRYGDDDMALKYSKVRGYVSHNRQAVVEMFRQVGKIDIDNSGIASKGLIVRHLILPNGISGTDKVLRFIKENISADTYISMMSQYTPLYKACGDRQLSRAITRDEYDAALGLLDEYGLSNGSLQEYKGRCDFKNPFLGVNIRRG